MSFAKYGAPFLILIVGGSFALKEFAQLRYTFSKQKTLTPDEAAKFGIQMKPREEVSLENVYEKTKSINISDWENKRGPRPWEETEGQKH